MTENYFMRYNKASSAKRGSKKMPDSEAKKRWAKENMLLIGLKLHRKNDADIIEYLTDHNHEKQMVIKEAIREYIKKNRW